MTQIQITALKMSNEKTTNLYYRIILDEKGKNYKKANKLLTLLHKDKSVYNICVSYETIQQGFIWVSLDLVKIYKQIN